MTERFRETFKDLNMTSEEVTRFAEAMKKEEFRKLLVEYAEEISDPKNRQLYEEEISKLEQERGNDVVFVHPEPGYCIKTTQNGSLKCFVNVCKNATLEKPTAEREVRKGAGSGLVWQIPHTCSKPREDLDQSGKNECVVYDVVFHPDAYRMGETNQRFNQLLKDSAFDTIENNFGVKLDRVNAKVLKNLNFKGKPTASVIRRPAASKPAAAVEPSQSTASSDPNDQIGSIIDQLKKDYFEKQSKDSAGSKKQPVNKPPPPVSKTEASNKQSIEQQEGNKKYTVPVYKMVHRGQIDMQDYSANIDNSIVATTRPKELFIQIELPLCKSSVDLILDIFEKRLYLESNEPDYKLDLKLPYPVDEKEARAKFDKSKRCLNVTLPVVSFSAKVEIIDNVENGHVSVNEPQSSDETPQVNKEEEKETKSHSVPSIKYNLPSKTYVSEYKSSYSIRMKISSYDPESVRLSIVDDVVIRVYAESTSKSSGYTQYYQAYVRISDKLKTDQLTITQNIGLDNMDQVKSSLRIVLVNEDFFEIKILKKMFQNALSNFWISSSSSNATDSSKIEVNTDTASQIDQVWTESQTNKSSAPLSDVSNSKNLNELSRKDYVLGFEQNMSKLDEDDSDEEDAKNKENKAERRSKFDKIDQIEKQRFEKKRPAPLCPPATIDEEIVDEEAEDDDQNMSDTEKDYLQKQSTERSRPMDIGGSLRNDENNNSMNSLSSSANDFGSSLSSSSNTFYRLKSILKKPRSVSESESSNSSPGLPSDAPDSMPSMSGVLSRGGSLTSQMSQNSSDDQQQSQSKRVSFSNNVIRNTFKTGSTVAGMRKPGHASKKKNKRKRTVSDPSHDSGADAMDLKQSMNNGSDSRGRSMSESSDDNMFMTASNESLEDENETESGNKQPEVVETNNASTSGKKKKKKKNNQIAESKKDDASKTTADVPTPKNGFNVETMLEWKNQGKLSEESQNGTKCGFKFKNKLIDQLD